jgi:hypothetical protein
MLGFGWLVASETGTNNQACPCEKESQSIESKKTNDFGGIDLDDLIAKYEKYQYLMNQLGLSHEKSSYGYGKFLKYVAFPAALGSFWVTINTLVNDNYDGWLKLGLPREYAWSISWLTGTVTLLTFLYAGDYFENSHEAIHARLALADFLKGWEKDSTTIPEELQPMFKLLQQFCKKDGKIDLEDRLLIALVKEIAKKHTATRDQVRKCMAQVNAQVNE